MPKGAFLRMTAQPVRPERSRPEAASVMDVSPFKPSLVKAVFRDVTLMHVSRAAAWAAASVTRTVLTEIIDGARGAAVEEARTKLIPRDLLSAIDRNVELEVGSTWYAHSPTFRGLTGVVYDAEGVLVPSRKRSGSRKPSAVVGAHRFEAGVRKPGEPAPQQRLEDSLRDPSVRRGDRRTIGRDDILAAVTMQLFGGLRQRALTEAREATRNTSAG